MGSDEDPFTGYIYKGSEVAQAALKKHLSIMRWLYMVAGLPFGQRVKFIKLHYIAYRCYTQPFRRVTCHTVQLKFLHGIAVDFEIIQYSFLRRFCSLYLNRNIHEHCLGLNRYNRFSLGNSRYQAIVNGNDGLVRGGPLESGPMGNRGDRKCYQLFRIPHPQGQRVLVEMDIFKFVPFFNTTVSTTTGDKRGEEKQKKG